MIQFAEKFPDEQIVAALLRQLGWTHFTLLLPIKDSLRREFYAEMCRIERWNTRTLQKKIQSMLFERTALSRRPQQLAQVELKALRERDQLTQTWYSAIHTFWIFLASRTRTRRGTWRLPSCARWNPSSSNSELDFRFLNVRRG